MSRETNAKNFKARVFKIHKANVGLHNHCSVGNFGFVALGHSEVTPSLKSDKLLEPGLQGNPRSEGYFVFCGFGQESDVRSYMRRHFSGFFDRDSNTGHQVGFELCDLSVEALHLGD